MVFICFMMHYLALMKKYLIPFQNKSIVGKAIINTLDLLKHSQGKTMLAEFSSKYSDWRILIGTILSARSRDEVTEILCEDLFRKYPTLNALSKAKAEDVEKIIKKIGFYKNKTRHVLATAKILVQTYHEKVPQTMNELMKLPGVGRKVAGCVMVYAHGLDAIPVDTHVHRIANRLGWVCTKHPEQTEKELEKIVPKAYWKWVNDLMVRHGKTVCKPITPHCSQCRVNQYCKQVNVKRKK
jgi:endonuclease III